MAMLDGSLKSVDKTKYYVYYVSMLDPCSASHYLLTTFTLYSLVGSCRSIAHNHALFRATLLSLEQAYYIKYQVHV